MSAPKPASPLDLAKAPTARLFFALWPSNEAAENLAGTARNLAARFGGRATRAETIHLTLAFLGEVDTRRLAEIEATAAALNGSPFTLVFDQFEFWRRRGLIVATCPCPPPLVGLVDALRTAMATLGLPVGLAEHEFKPHVTLVRKAAAIETTTLPALPSLVWPCDRFSLVRSLLSAAGPAYETVAEFSLAA